MHEQKEHARSAAMPGHPKFFEPTKRQLSADDDNSDDTSEQAPPKKRHGSIASVPTQILASSHLQGLTDLPRLLPDCSSRLPSRFSILTREQCPAWTASSAEFCNSRLKAIPRLQ